MSIFVVGSLLPESFMLLLWLRLLLLHSTYWIPSTFLQFRSHDRENHLHAQSIHAVCQFDSIHSNVVLNSFQKFHFFRIVCTFSISSITLQFVEHTIFLVRNFAQSAKMAKLHGYYLPINVIFSCTLIELESFIPVS